MFHCINGIGRFGKQIMRSHSCYILVDEGFRNAKYAPSGEVKLKSEEPVKDANWVGYGDFGDPTWLKGRPLGSCYFPAKQWDSEEAASTGGFSEHPAKESSAANVEAVDS